MIGRSNLFITLINQNNPDAYDKIEDALERGNLSPDASDDNGATLLLCAVRRRNYRLAELLLNEGANPFIISKYGQCAAGLIERFGDDRLRRIVQDVGDSGAIFDAVGEAWPIAQGLCLDAALGRTSEIRKKVAGGISVEERDAWGHTALMLAVLHGQDQAAQALFQSGANPESPQTLLGYQMIRFLNALKFLQADEFTQSMTAIYKKLSVFLFQSPSSTEAITTDNLASIASIHHLVRRSDITRIERLLALGVSPLLKNSRGFSALDVADQTHETQAKEVLLRHAGMQVPCPAGGRAVASASTASAPKAGQLTVNKDRSVDSGAGRETNARKTEPQATEPCTRNAQKLVETGDVVGLQVLLSSGVPPDAVMGRTSMFVYAARNNEHSFLFLLLNGGSLNLPDPSGTTARRQARRSSPRIRWLADQFALLKKREEPCSAEELMRAVMTGNHAEVAALAAANRRFLSASTEHGLTALGVASGNNDLLLCEILLDLGADPWQACLGGRLAVELTNDPAVRQFISMRMERMKAWVKQSHEPLKTTWYESACRALEEGGPPAEVLDAPEPALPEGTPYKEPSFPEVPSSVDSDDFGFIDDAAAAASVGISPEESALSDHPVPCGLLDKDFGIFSEEASDGQNKAASQTKPSDDAALVPPSAASLSESLRGLGYSLGAAVADIVDNAIAADASRVWVNYSSDDRSNLWFSVRDDGFGMNDKELQAAMKVGSKSPKALRAKTDLGRFGLGLKTASFSQCRRLVVCSVKDGKASAYAWDLDELAQKDEWLLERVELPLEDPRFEPLKHRTSGTVVLWEKIDRAFGSVEASDEEFRKTRLEALDRLRKHLRLTFHQYLTPDMTTGKPDIEILFGPGCTKLEPWDPFMSSSFAAPCRYQEEFWPIDASKPQVAFRPYVVPAPKTSHEEITLYGAEDLLDMQGFFIYRGKRLICCAGWLNLGIQKTPLRALARIRLTYESEHDLDWELDIRKSTVKIPRRNGWSRLRQLLCRRADAAIKKSEEVLGACYDEENVVGARADVLGRSMWSKERGQAPQLDFSSRLATAFRDALARVSEPDIVQGLLELMAYSHPAASSRAETAEVSLLGRAAIVELAYELAEGKAEKVRESLELLASHAPFSSWPAIMDEFKEEQ